MSLDTPMFGLSLGPRSRPGGERVHCWQERDGCYERSTAALLCSGERRLRTSHGVKAAANAMRRNDRRCSI
jgi:hypothetical protein